MPMQASTIDLWTHGTAAIVSDIADALRREKIVGLCAERRTHIARYPLQKMPDGACWSRCKNSVPNGRPR
jgi:hypothetical protein